MIKNNVSVLYFVIPLCLVIVFFTLWYGYPFEKFTDQNLKVYQLALTSFAATVGIGTVVNSTISAHMSRQSIEIIQHKESREQSSHLITSSIINKFSISPPMYKSEYIYRPAMSTAEKLDELNFTKHDSFESYNQAKNNFEESLRGIMRERLENSEKINMLRVLNIGKASGLNIEYSFQFENINDFCEYSIRYNENKHGKYEYVAPSLYPSYDIMTKKYKNYFKIVVLDHTILKYAEDAQLDDGIKYYYSESDINFIDTNQKTYVDFIKPGEEIELPIPNEFMILCKHYLIMTLYKKIEKQKGISKYIKPGIHHLIEGKSIAPIGRITISYLDEEDVRKKEKNLVCKQITLSVKIKEESIYLHDDNINFYLEFSPIS